MMGVILELILFKHEVLHYIGRFHAKRFYERDLKKWVNRYVAQEPFSAFRKFIPKVSMFQGTWELVGNFPNLAGIIQYGWELIGNFYPLKLGTWELYLACFLHWELPHIHDYHVGC